MIRFFIYKVKEDLSGKFETNDEKQKNKEEVEVIVNLSNVKISEKEEEKIEQISKKIFNKIDDPTSFNNFAESKKPVKVIKGKGIKKVDIDFDFDGFDDVGFSTSNNSNITTTNNKNKIDKDKDKDKEEESDFVSGLKLEEESQVQSQREKDLEKERRKKFENKKAISSDDYNNFENDFSKKQNDKKLNQLKGNTAVCSSDIFGEEVEGKKVNLNLEQSLGQTLKDYALKFTLSAAEKAKEVIYIFFKM
jgi:hypothetical protein